MQTNFLTGEDKKDSRQVDKVHKDDYGVISSQLQKRVYVGNSDTTLLITRISTKANVLGNTVMSMDEIQKNVDTIN